MYQIVNVLEYKRGTELGIRYIHDKWGSEKNYAFYEDAIIHSSTEKGKIPKFFVLILENEIVGCYGLIINDFISRHDLYPWFCCLFVNEEHRGKKLTQQLMDHAKNELAGCGFDFLYLTTDHETLYERFGWTRIEDGYEPSGEATRIYKLAL